MQGEALITDEQARRFVRAFLDSLPATPVGPPPTRRQRLKAWFRQTRVRLAWEVLRGRNPAELHEDCW